MASRIQFANDTANLVVSLPSVNRSKGTKDIAQWQPDTDSGKCDYLAMVMMCFMGLFLRCTRSSVAGVC